MVRWAVVEKHGVHQLHGPRMSLLRFEDGAPQILQVQDDHHRSSSIIIVHHHFPIDLMSFRKFWNPSTYFWTT